MEKKFTIGVFGFIFNVKREVLLCHRRDYDLWNPPGGQLENGESPWQGVVRELKEETGLDVIVERLTGVYSKLEKNDIVFAFLCKEVGGKITLNDEADEIKYFPVDKLPYHISPKQVERLTDLLENKEITLRVQDSVSSVELFKLKKLK